jgi:hypothetical protein
MIDREDIERLKEIFVTRQECDNSMDEVNKKLANDSTELAVIKTQLKMIIWILSAVGGGVITMIIKMFWGA